MTTRTVTLDGKEYVMVPRRDWDAIVKGQKMRTSNVTAFSIDDVRTSLAAKVAKQRKALGLTQDELAKLAGVRVETISRLENGLHMPSARTFDSIDRGLRRAAGRKRPAA